MRTLILSAALVLAAGAASAQPALTPHRPATPLGQVGEPATPPPQADLPPDVSTTAADLSGLNTRIEQDEIVLTRLTNAELAAENAVLLKIKPALKFHDRNWFPARY